MKATRVNPLLLVKDMSKSIDFYERVLGFDRNTVIKNDDGSLRYVDFVVGSSVLMLVPESSRNETISGKGNGIELYIDVDEDIKSLFTQLKNRGLAFTKELYETPWHTLQFHFKDPDGYVLIVSQEIKK